MSDLTHRVAVVTGAARGVGAETSRRLAAAGATVVLTDVLDDLGAATAADIDGASYRSLDVTDEDAWASVVGEIVDEHGRLDVLVNNAAVLYLGTIENTPPDAYRRVLEVNTVGPFLGIQAVIPPMKAAERGSIVNISSIDGMIGMNGIPAYAASKFGVRGLTKSAALELGRSGIRVNAVCTAGGNPAMYGNWMDQLMEDMDDMMAYQNDRAIPGGVEYGPIADAVVYLAGDTSSAITGADIPVDNGALAGKWLAPFNNL